MRGNLPPVWEGVWTGLNVLKLVKGVVSGTIRTFAFCQNLTTNKIELWELLPESTDYYLDNGETRIQWGYETPALFKQDIKPITELCQLSDGEMYISDILGAVTVTVQYRPDFHPDWQDWKTFTLCSTGSNPGYAMRVGFGSPSSDSCESVNNRSLRVGNFFQFRVLVTGSCKINGIKFVAGEQPQPECPKPQCETSECQVLNYAETDYFLLYNLQG